MAGDTDELRTTLERLHDQLGSTDALDADVRNLLQQVLGDISSALESGEADGSLGGRLGELTEQFEEEHPSLAEAVGRVVNLLANLGI